LFKRLDERGRKTLLVDFKPLPNSKLGELAANFDIVLGGTVNELDLEPLRGTAPPLQRRPG
jgi:protocatechuate 3,4-dioxygenase beta subunit